MIRTRLQGGTPFFPNMLNNGKVEVCLKEDVDKTLAEKDKVIVYHKYKRCVDKVELCETKLAYYIASCDRYDSKYVNKKAFHFYKWKYKWLELAERFKGVVGFTIG